MSDETTVTETVSAAPETHASTESASHWKNNLPDDIRTDVTLTNIDDITTLAKGFVSAQRMLGGRIAIPSKDASEEARAEFYNRLETVPGVVNVPSEEDAQLDAKMSKVYEKLGRPTSPDSYKLEIPEGISIDEEFVTSFKKAAHDAGLNNKQLAKIAQVQIEHETKLSEFTAARHTNAESFLKKQWGAAYSDHKQLVDKVLDKYAAKCPDAVQEIRNTSMGDNPIISLLAAELGKAYAESGAIAPNTSGKAGLTPDDATSRIAEISGNRAHAYHDSNNPGHEDAVKQMNRYYAAAYPDLEK